MKREEVKVGRVLDYSCPVTIVYVLFELMFEMHFRWF